MRSSRSSQFSGRVFIMGAGASAFAGFPLGHQLFSFLIDHADLNASLAWLAGYVVSLPYRRRKRELQDIEWLLTKVERGDIELFDPSRSSVAAWRSILQHMRHHRANRERLGSSLAWFLEGQKIRQGSGIDVWHLEGLIETIIEAFTAHHTCFLHAGRHFDGIRHGFYGNIPYAFQGNGLMKDKRSRGRCPCATRYTWRRRHRVIDALARKLGPGDCAITFNWDALLEGILWSAGKWSISDGYGISVEIDKEQLDQLAGRQARRVLRPSPVKVLKPHGSINWISYVTEEDEKRPLQHDVREVTMKNGSMGWAAIGPNGEMGAPRSRLSDFSPQHLGIRFLGLLFDLPIYSTYPPPFDPYGEDGLGPDPPEFIMPILSPTYNKDYASFSLLGPIWDQIGQAVEAAREVTVIGYSLPEGDASARDRLGAALSRNTACDRIELVPENGNWIEFAKAVGKKAHARFATLEEWVADPSS